MSSATGALTPAGVTRIGRYEVIGPLAEGGMAEILLGRVPGERSFARAVVIKRVLRHLARTKSFEAMFLDEARIVSAIHHPNVVQVFDLGRDGDELFMVMEYLEGESAAGLMRRLAVRGEAPDPFLAAHIVAEVCAGLHAAHELKTNDGDPQHLVHRDVNPHNVFIGYDGSVKLLDFGVAKAVDRMGHTEAGQVKGKFGYMSPEQCRGAALDRRSDVFALGILLYELATGHRLFQRATEMLTFRAICSDRLVAPSEVRAGFPSSLESICLKALRRDRAQRYATAAEMRRELIAAGREAREEEAAEERLAELMRRVFPDRMEEKAELMRRVRSGTTVPTVPPAEIDLAAQLPSVVAEAGESAGRPGEVSTSTPRLAKGARLAVALLAGAGVLGAAVMLHAQRAAPGPDPVAPPLPVGESRAPPAESASAEPAADLVFLSIATDPPGARVVVAGAPQGNTPLDVPVVRSTERLEVELSRGGYSSVVEVVVPDRDQKLRLTLTPAPPARRGLRAPAAQPAPTTSPARSAGPGASARSGYYQF